jgi:uncharacterized protein YjbI with pentapeptide repeats
MTASPEEYDGEVPEDRCGFTFSKDFDALEAPFPDNESCCARDPLPDTDRCVFHADPDNTETKAETLAEIQPSGDSLDGAILSDGLVDEVDLSDVSLLRDADLSDADLRDANLSAADFREADLSDAILSDANLSAANLSGAFLFNADLSGAEVFDADLSGTDLMKADLSGAYLHSADLSGTLLRDVDLSEANLRFADLSGAGLIDDLSGADLSEADLSGAVLPAVDLSEANLRLADLSDADLRDADLSDADLRDTDFSDADLTEADLREDDLEGAEFHRADLREATLTSSDCEGAEFNGAILNRASLENADLVRAQFPDAHLFGTRLTGAQIDSQTQFAPDGPVGDLDTPNPCRYDSELISETSFEAVIENGDEIEDKQESAEVIRARRARSTYRRLEELARQNGFPDLQSEMFVRRQDARRELLFAKSGRIKGSFAQAQKWLFNYGESFSRIFGVSALTILLAWGLYMTTGIVEDTSGNTIDLRLVITEPLLIYDTFIHSVLVFFTGNQVLTTTGRVGRGIITIESMVGPILVALLIFVLGRRAAR